MKKRLLAVLLAGTMVMSMAACGGKDSGKEEKTASEDVVNVAVLLKPESNEYWASMKAGIEEWAADQDDLTVDIYCAESEDNIQGQLEQMENIIMRSVQHHSPHLIL